jgi:hypothetical protein
VARRRRAERFYACGALELSRAARSTRTLDLTGKNRAGLTFRSDNHSRETSRSATSKVNCCLAKCLFLVGIGRYSILRTSPCHSLARQHESGGEDHFWCRGNDRGVGTLRRSTCHTPSTSCLPRATCRLSLGQYSPRDIRVPAVLPSARPNRRILLVAQRCKYCTCFFALQRRYSHVRSNYALERSVRTWRVGAARASESIARAAPGRRSARPAQRGR